MNVIGIAVRIEKLDNSWKYFTNQSYLEKVHAFGWTAILLSDADKADAYCDLCDALLLPGGYDVASFYFHQPIHAQAHLYEQPQDHLDFCLLHAFVKAKKPILGICRGLQLINVYFHGTLCQHFDITRHEEGEHVHRIFPQSNTIFEQLLMPEETVNSYHHQTIEQLGDDLVCMAKASDGRIEAIMHEQLPILAVQWHPEKLIHDAVLPYFFDVLSRR